MFRSSLANQVNVHTKGPHDWSLSWLLQHGASNKELRYSELDGVLATPQQYVTGAHGYHLNLQI